MSLLPDSQTLVAVQMGKTFASFCQGRPQGGKVHSVFKHVANIRVGDTLLAVAGKNSGGSARFLAIHGHDLFRLDLEAGQDCLFSEGRVRLGDFIIDVARLPLWQSPLPADAQGTVRPDTLVAFKAVIDRNSPGAGRHACIGRETVAALGQVQTAGFAVNSLIGLGPGLTPAGDDIVLGYLAACNHLTAPKPLKTAIGEAVGANLQRTCDISGQMLKDACEHEYHEFIATVIANLLDNCPHQLKISVPRLLSLGASSGADIAYGMLSAIIMINTMELR